MVLAAGWRRYVRRSWWQFAVPVLDIGVEFEDVEYGLRVFHVVFFRDGAACQETSPLFWQPCESAADGVESDVDLVYKVCRARHAHEGRPVVDVVHPFVEFFVGFECEVVRLVWYDESDAVRFEIFTSDRGQVFEFDRQGRRRRRLRTERREASATRGGRGRVSAKLETGSGS